MPATIIGTTSVATGGTAATTSPSAAMPSGTQGGDVLLAFHAIGSSSTTITFPAGWSTPVRNTGITGVGDSFAWKIASGTVGSATTESALVVTASSARNHGLVVVAVRMSDNSNPVVLTASNTTSPASTSKVTPGGTASGDILELNFVADHPAGSTSTVSNWAAPSGFTILGAPSATQNGFQGTSIAVGANNTNPTSSGSVPSRTWTTALSCVGSAWSIAVKSGAAAPVTPTLTSRLVGIGKVKVKTSDATSVRLKIGTNTGVTTGVTYTSAQTPNSEGYTTHDVSGLATNSTFYYRVAMTDSGSTESLDTASTVGRIKTKASGSFAFTFASCCNATDSASLAAIATRADDFFLHTGDLYYADGSGTSAANFRAKFDAKITATNHAAVFATTPSVFIPSDHDGGMNNNYVGTGDTTARDSYSLVYRERIPTTVVPATTGIYHAFSWGRVRFIMMDCRSFKSANGATDNSSKTILGATQKQWVKDEITNATEPVIILVGDVPWTGATTAGQDHWGGYNTERQELVAHFATVPTKKIGYIGGDMHAVAADNGTNSAGSIPDWQGGPLNNNASIKGGPWSAGTYPASGTAVVDQYGRMVVTDAGSTITFAFTGYSSDNTSRITQSTVFTVSSSSGSASSSFTFTGSIATGTRTPKGSGSGSYTYTSAATGKEPASGSASGAYTFAGSATGNKTPRGSASGSWVESSTATGQRSSRGSASGGYAFSGVATGQKTQRGSASGSYSIASSASGVKPVVGAKSGSAAGSFAYASSATGRKVQSGSTAPAYSFTAASTGSRASRGAATTGAYAYVGSATGARPAVGSKSGAASGSWAYTGQVTGKKIPHASSLTTYTFTSSATGRKVARGSGQATYAFLVTAEGYQPGSLRDVTITARLQRDRLLVTAEDTRLVSTLVPDRLNITMETT